MTWVKLDDSLPDHPKFVGLPDSAKWLWIVGLCYAGRYLTDGFVPDSALKTGEKRLAKRLETARLWVRDPDDNGWLIHSYLDYQPSRAVIEEDRRRRSEAGKKGARKRWQEP